MPTDAEDAFKIQPLGKHHDRAAFSCGREGLDRYIRKQARQDAENRVAAPFVLIDTNSSKIAGYYTLSAMGINLGDLPEDVARKLPKYPVVPATLLGRLAIDVHYHGQGLGEFLLMDALYQSWQTAKKIASFAVVVDAKDEQAEAFYAHYEFQAFPTHKGRLFLAMKKIEQLFRG